ncbi:hypothetical protein QEG98_38375 [Myxococcus sp. MxC21-1]|nr:hypothetical protein QEG98_38375 [Myxococcus sp. MxC21-1]
MPSSLEFVSGISLVPSDSPARELLAAAAARAGLRVVGGLEEASLALVDLTAPGGLAAGQALVDAALAAHLTLVVLVAPGESHFAEAQSLKPADVLTAPVAMHELAGGSSAPPSATWSARNRRAARRTWRSCWS